jgi:hypothetical protein
VRACCLTNLRQQNCLRSSLPRPATRTWGARQLSALATLPDKRTDPCSCPATSCNLMRPLARVPARVPQPVCDSLARVPPHTTSSDPPSTSPRRSPRARVPLQDVQDHWLLDRANQALPHQGARLLAQRDRQGGHRCRGAIRAHAGLRRDTRRPLAQQARRRRLPGGSHSAGQELFHVCLQRLHLDPHRVGQPDRARGCVLASPPTPCLPVIVRSCRRTAAPPHRRTRPPACH